MKRITRCLVTAAGLLAMAGAPSVFGAEFHTEHARYERDRIVRRDQERLRRDMALGHYRAADRDRAILRRDERWR
jgi:hypothetical protein